MSAKWFTPDSHPRQAQARLPPFDVPLPARRTPFPEGAIHWTAIGRKIAAEPAAAATVVSAAAFETHSFQRIPLSPNPGDTDADPVKPKLHAS